MLLHLDQLEILNKSVFKEDEHPRDQKGRFTDKYKSAIDEFFKNNKDVPKIPVKLRNQGYSNGGGGFYATSKRVGSKTNNPKYIEIGNYDAIHKYPEEFIDVLAHELAHHTLNVKSNNLRHGSTHNKETEKIAKELMKYYNAQEPAPATKGAVKAQPKLSKEELKKVQEKLAYWKANKESLSRPEVDYDKEIKIMEDKLKANGIEPTKKAPAKTSSTKTPAKPKATTKKASEPKKGASKTTDKKTKAKAEIQKTRKKIDEIADSRPVEKKKKAPTAKEAKKAIEEATKKPNPKAKQGKGATKADLDKLAKENEKAKKKPGLKPATKEDLDEMFGASEPKKKPATKKTSSKKKDVADIRTEGQVNHDVSYDVGNKIYGSKKDKAQERKALEDLLGRNSGQALDELEAVSPELAQKNCTKKNLLPPVDFEAEHKRGTEVNVAMAKQLIYDRILPKPLTDHPEGRKQYLEAIRNLQRVLEPIKTWDDLRETCYSLGQRMKRETPSFIQNQRNYLDYAQRELAKEPTEYDLSKYDVDGNRVRTSPEQWKADKQKRVDEVKASLKKIAEAQKEPYAVLGDKAMKFFTDYESRNRTFDTVRKKGLTWDRYFEAEKQASEAPKEKKESKTKVTWERIMPKQIQRVGGRTSKVQKPEDMVKDFGFSGIEFGHWVDDTSGNFHMKKCAEAFQDLADILGIKDKDVSFNGKLSIAFGARGSGQALAHYEPDTKAINITKMGGAGSLAHEWGHAMDNMAYQESVGRRSTSLASNGMGDDGSPEVKSAYKKVMEAILHGSGEGVEYVENKHNKYYSYHPSFKKLTEDVGFKEAIKQITSKINTELAHSQNYYEGLRGKYPDETINNLKEKSTRKHLKALRDMVQEVAYHHENHTGEKLDTIPMPTGMSKYYQDSKEVGGNSSKYWTSHHELFARAFENYIEGKMRAGKVKNDYLVHGTWASEGTPMFPYPKGSERDEIHKAMDELMKAIKEAKVIQKALAIMELN